LSEAIAGATEQAQQAAHLFSEQAVVLQRITSQSVSETEGMAQNLSARADQLQSLMNAIEAVNNRIGTATVQAGQTTQNLAVAAQKIEAAVDIYETDAHKQNARLFGNLEKVLSVFRAQGELLDQEVGKIANRIAVVESGMAESARRLQGTAEQAVLEFENAGGALTRQTEDFRSAAMTLKGDLNEIHQQMESVGRRMVARSLLNNIENKDMLAEAAAILDQLQALSVDMAQLFSPKVVEELWARYHGGDKTVFMRHIRSELGGATAKKMKELYQSDRSFKKAAQGYMAAFEKMTQKVGQDDNNKMLLSIVIGSDAGRLYMVLADVLKGN
jgi:predicted  nucleic acid-binding Zn-ribbon protein/ribosomal protein S24E